MEDTRIVLVWAERPYIQSTTARVTDTVIVGVIDGRERKQILGLWWKD